MKTELVVAQRINPDGIGTQNLVLKDYFSPADVIVFEDENGTRVNLTTTASVVFHRANKRPVFVIQTAPVFLTPEQEDLLRDCGFKSEKKPRVRQ